MSGTPEVWASFSRDPRLPEHAPLRASDADRDVVHQVLTEAYADGRLDREEFDARTNDVQGARTLGELATQLDGLVPVSTLPALAGPGSALMTPDQIQDRAVAKWREDRRSSAAGFLFVSAICWVIWWVVSRDSIYWPVFPMLVAGINALRVATSRDEMVAEERRRLEKKQRKALEKRRADDDT